MALHLIGGKPGNTHHPKQILFLSCIVLYTAEFTVNNYQSKRNIFSEIKQMFKKKKCDGRRGMTVKLRHEKTLGEERDYDRENGNVSHGSRSAQFFFFF